jgi:hypothetical protein
VKIKVGDEIEVDSEKTGTPPREGRVLEVIEAEWGTRYHILWHDGHDSTIHPMGGTLHIRRPRDGREPSEAECGDCDEALTEVWR